MIGGIGAVRFRDLYSRMHAAAKAPTLGLVLVAIGAAIAIDTLLAITMDGALANERDKLLVRLQRAID